MIIDILKSKGVPFRCDNCHTCFAWKPDEQGVCARRAVVHPQCKKSECEYYKPAKKKCPECGSDDISEMSAIVYKIVREIRR